ncbi:FAD-binding oxidoreductase [Roseateles asaccharophilus]|uniref:D-arginine dehydrogenase n=1 Tax=Roseateles asaccharophilus TaxID=582607 RepID=A0ABU2A8S0_9BURK|nr:FAD-binding oxidoreductase [Roseateles asaccharophilus]MDR7333604.1 D-arginine dehydrogenase [Roseateles asaccharophilus]
MGQETTKNVDCIVIGAGIAGASVAASLAGEASVAVLEMEPHAGYHSTGRSAALYSALYGNATIRALTRASLGYFRTPPQGMVKQALLRERHTLFLVGAGQLDLVAGFTADADVRERTTTLNVEEVLARVPLLQRERIAGALLDETSADIDVDLLHQGFLRAARAAGAQLYLDTGLQALEREGGKWLARTATGSFRAGIVVNAAGAWADDVAALAGIAPVPLQPLRRTAVLVDLPDGVDATLWPAVVAIDESQYFKPDAGLLLISAADETPSPACDAQPEELDVAIAVDRFETLTGQPVRRVRHRWAGLRVFSPDRTPVVGFEPSVPGFFWCAGQGGYGIQTSPALGRAAAELALGRSLPRDLADLGVTAQQLSPQRFRPGSA